MNDRCAECFELLKPASLGSRYACLQHPRAAYWTEAVPREGSEKAALKSRHGRSTLYLYGGYFALRA